VKPSRLSIGWFRHEPFDGQKQILKMELRKQQCCLSGCLI
jgi:hypothetical protein